jgi:hypothetical protein
MDKIFFTLVIIYIYEKNPFLDDHRSINRRLFLYTHFKFWSNKPDNNGNFNTDTFSNSSNTNPHTKCFYDTF